MINVKLDLSEFLKVTENLERQAKRAMEEAARDLTMATHGKLVELASEKLHTRRQMYLDNLSFNQVNDNTWFITLDGKARWIDDGVKKHNMLDSLLNSDKAKTAKDGSKYLVVPFNHSPGQGSTQATPAQQNLIQTVKAEMQKRGIPFGKIERDAKGQARLGRLHSFNITDQPVKTHDGPGQGKGPIGKVMQGPSGVPLLQSVNVYQKLVKQPGGIHRLQRAVMTFRVASSKHQAEGGRWDHPGLEPMELMEEAADWALKEWSEKIAPAVISKLIQNLD